MRVALLIDRWWPRRGGAEAALCALAERLHAEGHEPIAISERGPREGEASPCAVHLVRGGGLTRSRRERALARALPQGARAVSADVTLGVRHLAEVDLLWLHGGAHRASLQALARARGQHQARAPRGHHQLFCELERAALQGGARRVLVPSALVAEELAAEYGEGVRERVEVVLPAVDVERFHPSARVVAERELRAALDVDAATPLLVHPARYPALKGCRELLAALARLQDRPWHLLVSGSPLIAEWRREVQHVGLPEQRVTVAADTPALTLAAGADLCVLPTWRDTAGLALAEALSCGTPVLTSVYAGLAPLAADRPSCAVVGDPADLEELAGALRRCLDSPAPDRQLLRDAVAELGAADPLGQIVEVLCGLARAPRSGK